LKSDGIVEDSTRERVALVTDTSLSGARQIPELDCQLIGRP